jgi:hypothetical protein
MVNEIEYLALHKNNLRGSIPNWIGSLNLLVSLRLSRNDFSGELPIGINLERLRIYDTKVDGISPF